MDHIISSFYKTHGLGLGFVTNHTLLTIDPYKSTSLWHQHSGLFVSGLVCPEQSCLILALASGIVHPH